MPLRSSSALLLVLLAAGPALAEDRAPADLLKSTKRIVFLGDSITAAGKYVAGVEAWLIARRGPLPAIIDAGLPSETVSGLSEEGHAGGKFPRPDLAERLDRVLALTKPDLVVACYGINCGIYEPFEAGRFEKYQAGIQRLKAAVEKAGAKLVLVTPPTYDDQRAPKAFKYNEVLDKYSAWLLEQRAKGWMVVDLHGPMSKELEIRRAADPKFTFQPDGVHPNDDGHWFVAAQLIRWFGDDDSPAAPNPAAMLKHNGAPATLLSLVEQKVGVLRDAYVAAAGHKRPGVAQGLPVPEAEKKAAEINARIAVLLGKQISSKDSGEWVPLFNGKNLDGWTPKIRGYASGDNFGDTFRVENGVLKVSYDKYDDFSAKFGHLFYKEKLSNYVLRVEYRFVGKQAKGGPGWAVRNSGVMVHGESPETMAKDQEFPASIEVQLLGGTGSGERTTANLCTPGTNVVMNGELITRHCTSSKSKTYHGDQWVTVEIEVHGSKLIRHLIDGQSVLEYTEPQLDERDAHGKELARKQGKLLSEGTISLQSESHPVEFRKVELKRLTE